MESLLNDFSSLSATQQTFVSHFEQLHFMRKDAKQYLKNGCNDHQYIHFHNFNQLIITKVNFSQDIYSERVVGLLDFITDKMNDFDDPDIHTRLLASYQVYDSIISLLLTEEIVERETSYNYNVAPTKKENDGFWFDM